MVNSFKDYNLKKEIQKGINAMGFEEPSPIQSLTLPQTLKNKDIIGQSQTGSGKTLAFAIPVLNKIFLPDKSPQALILCPTRELSLQVASEMGKLSAYMNKIKILPVYGGQPIGRQIRVLKKGVHIVIGTPGRIIDHIGRKTLDLSGVETVVLDEADEMLDMGFRDDIETILKRTPKQRQTLLFSATFPSSIRKLTKKYQKNPKHLKVKQQQLVVPKINQYYYQIKESEKLDTLCKLIDIYDLKLSLVFCNTKREVRSLSRELSIRGYPVERIHGDMEQVRRDAVMKQFRNHEIEILVATDVAARGIDVPNVEAVFNYDLPTDNEYYVHRIGRTGRAGKTGYAFTFVSGKEIFKLRDIKKYAKAKIRQKNVPSYKDLERMRMKVIIERVCQTIEREDLAEYRKEIESLIEMDYDSVEIASALLKILKDD